MVVPSRHGRSADTAGRGHAGDAAVGVERDAAARRLGDDRDELRAAPVPQIARDYYEAAEPFLFDLVSETCRPRLGDGGLVSESTATVTGFMDASISDFFDEEGAPAALFRIRAARRTWFFKNRSRPVDSW